MTAESHGPSVGPLLQEFVEAAERLLAEPSYGRDVLVAALAAAADVLGDAREYEELLHDGEPQVEAFRQAKRVLARAVREARRPAAAPAQAPGPAAASDPEQVSDPGPVHAPGDGPDRASGDTDSSPAGSAAPADPVPAESDASPGDEPVSAGSVFVADLLTVGTGLRSRFPRYDGPGRLPWGLGLQDPRALWEALHLSLLRVPTGRDEYRTAREKTLESVRDYLGPDAAEEVAGATAEPIGPDAVPLRIVPPLRGVHEGVELSQQPPDGFVLDERLRAWAVRVEQAVQLAALDPELQRDMQDGSNFPPKWLAAGNEQTRYAKDLRNCLEQLDGLLRNPNATTDDIVKNAQRLDGLIGAITHKVPAAKGSWWWNWRQEAARTALAEFVGGFGYVLVDVESLADATAIKVFTAVNRGGERFGQPVQWVLTTPIQRAGNAGGAGLPADQGPLCELYPGRLVRRPDLSVRG